MKKLLLLASLTIATLGFAQERCSFDRKVTELSAKNPAFARAYQESLMVETTHEDIQMRSSSPTTVVTIPVVVHVLWKTASQNISNAQINSQIAILNEDYRKLNADFTSVVPAAFQPFGADLEINFVLAVRTPDNQPTTGIVRKQIANSMVFDEEYYTAAGSEAWDPTSYLNIWVGPISEVLLGFAYPPAAVGQPFDGLCIGYKYFGNTGQAEWPYNKGRTATHEIGHYFNLQHIWGGGGQSDTSSCANNTGNNSDGIADTPKTYSAYYECGTYPDNQFTCTTLTDGAMFMNYMDYVPDACMGFFTAGQKTRALAALNGPRSGLLTSLGATPLGVDDFEAKSVSLYPNPASTYFTVNSPKMQIDAVEIFNSIGQKVKALSLDNGNNVVDVAELPAGVYIVRFHSGGKAVKSQRLIRK